MRRGSVASALQYFPELTWILFLGIPNNSAWNPAPARQAIRGNEPPQTSLAAYSSQKNPECPLNLSRIRGRRRGRPRRRPGPRAAPYELHALDEEARRFYLKYGFTPLADDPRHLYLPMKTVRKVFVA